jgi:hypothetical protein
MCFPGKISRERKVSHAAEDSTRARERERIPRKSVDGCSIPRERERERERTERSSKKKKKKKKKKKEKSVKKRALT